MSTRRNTVRVNDADIHVVDVGEGGPALVFLHYWGVGKAEQLAKGLKAALNQTGKKGDSDAKMKM